MLCFGNYAKMEDENFELVPFNWFEILAEKPEEVLTILQTTTGHQLTLEQKYIAKLSILELAASKKSTILDLAKTWETSPALSEVFA